MHSQSTSKVIVDIGTMSNSSSVILGFSFDTGSQRSPMWEIADGTSSFRLGQGFGKVSHCFNEIPQMTNGLASQTT